MNDLNIPMLDTIDLEILMHRDVHFGGSFSLMLEYYDKKGIGAMPDFSIKRMKKLQLEEEKLGKNLSELLLPSSAQEVIDDAKKMYLNLRDVYEKKTSSPERPLLIAVSDLIFSEEEEPKAEIESLCKYGKEAVTSLIDLLKTDELYDPLYPGYGRAPILAAQCLAKIRDERAITPLFEMLGQENFFTDDALISALVSFGNKAREFLLKRLSHKPFSKDNEHAAIVLTSFPEEECIAKACLELLQDPDMKKHTTLANYLILGCAALINPEDKKLFLSLKEVFPGFIKNEMDLIAKSWS